MKQPTQRQGYIHKWIRCWTQQELGVVLPDPHADYCVRVRDDGSEQGPRHDPPQVDPDCYSSTQCCRGCGAYGDKMHERHACPAANKSCFNCGIDGHFGRMCRKSLRPRNDCMTEPDKDPDPTPVIEGIEIFPSDGGVPFTFRMRLDTGCAVSLISEDVVTRQGLTVDTTSSKKIRTANGRVLNNSGTVTFGVEFQERTTEVVALVSSSIEGEILLSWQVLQKLGIDQNMEEHRYVKHIGDTQTPPKGDEADFTPTRLKSYQQVHQLTGQVQTGVPDPDRTDTKEVAVSQKDRLLRENARKTS